MSGAPDQTPSPPTRDEETQYYYGLPSQPKLIARSSLSRWQFQQDRWPIPKSLNMVQDHPIVNLWNSTASPLRQHIIQALGAASVNWTIIDILRIGYTKVPWSDDGEVPENPVTLLISVEPEFMTWPQGHAVAMRCRRILQQYGLEDMHCEIKESRYYPCAPPPSTAPPQAPRLYSSVIDGPYSQASLSELLGSSIAPYAHPTHEGTKGIYMRDKKTGALLALTCRHVVLDKSFPNVDFKHDALQSRLAVIQPGDNTLHKLHTLTLARRAMFLGYSNDTSTQAEVERDGEILQTLENLKDPDSRIIGHISLSPKYGTGPSPYGPRLRDWALVELHPNKHPTSLEAIKNRVTIGEAGIQELAEATDESPDTKLSLKFVNNKVIQLDGIILEHEMENPKTSTRADDASIMVALCDRTSRLSVGFANSVKSVIRQHHNNHEYISVEWCILGHKPKGRARKSFSQEGDSGSCVWDMEGRIGGMLTGGGAGQVYGALDTSYVTPVEWLIKDIKDHGMDVELV